jgi:hypothetical protein
VAKKSKPDEHKHWEVMSAYRRHDITKEQARARLSDLGCKAWEIEIYLDDLCYQQLHYGARWW